MWAKNSFHLFKLTTFLKNCKLNSFSAFSAPLMLLHRITLYRFSIYFWFYFIFFLFSQKRKEVSSKIKLTYLDQISKLVKQRGSTLYKFQATNTCTLTNKKIVTDFHFYFHFYFHFDLFGK